MTGPGYWESRLVAALNGVDEAPVNDDPTVWQAGSDSAADIAVGLEQALQAVMEDEVLGEATRASIMQSVTSMGEALTYRSGRLAIGESAAATAAAALAGAKSQFASLAGVPAAPTPETPLPLATPEERVATQQSNQQAAEQHAGLVAAREAACRTIYQELQTGLDTAADDYARINAQQPTGPDDQRGGNGPIGPGANRPTRPGRDDQGELEVIRWEPRDPDRDPDQDRDPDRDPDGIRPTPVDPINPTNPVLPVGPGTFTPGAPGENGLLEARPGVPPALGGGASPSVVGAGGGSGLAGTAVAGGVAAGAGLSAAMRAGGGGLLSGSGSAAGTSRPFVAGGGQGGAAARGGGATAGRGMAGAGAGANGRGGSGRGGAGGRGGRGAGGTGGRGATGGGGTAGRGAGRRRDRDEDDPRSFLGREDDWLDDDHTGPAVID